VVLMDNSGSKLLSAIADLEPGDSCVEVELAERSYSIDIEQGLLDRLGENLAGVHQGGKVAVITDRRVEKLYGQPVDRSLQSAGYQTVTLSVRPGERSKSVRTATRLCGELLDSKFDRSSLIVALGGGVVGDLAGFVAAVYMRGIAYVQVPTTLLAQVDSSVGGKVAVDHPECKNLIGAFHQPRYVAADTSVLATLPRREVRCGLAEIVKHTVLGDPDLFDRISADPEPFVRADPEPIGEAIRRSCALKAYVVTEDERESGLRAILNLGHTVGHALESAAGYSGMLHGEAVSYGMIAAARISERLGVAEEPVAEPISRTLKGLGLAGKEPVCIDGHSPATVFDLLRHDKKFRGGALRFVLPERIGSVRIVDNVAEQAVRDVLEQLVVDAGD